jgi:pseudaminic acid synthase
MPPVIEIAGRPVGAGHPAYIIAELSGNHGGDPARCRELVRLAAQAGADAVKLQTYTADTMTIRCDNEWFRIKGGLWDGYDLHRLYTEAHTPWAWHAELFAEAERAGIACFSTPFDATAVDFLERFAPPVYKLASFEVADVALIRRIAATRRPVIMSIGMASLAEVHQAVSTFRAHGTTQLAMLKCVSSYPATPEHFNLATIPNLAATFDVVPGLSDHSLGHTVAVAGTCLGATIIEKHFTRRRADGGPDAAFSMEPEEFAAMVVAARQAESAIGKPTYGAGVSEEGNIVFRRSCFVVADVRAGERLTAANVRVIRPGHGLPPVDYDRVVGRVAACDIARGTPLRWSMVGGP